MKKVLVIIGVSTGIIAVVLAFIESTTFGFIALLLLVSTVCLIGSAILDD